MRRWRKRWIKEALFIFDKKNEIQNQGNVIGVIIVILLWLNCPDTFIQAVYIFPCCEKIRWFWSRRWKPGGEECWESKILPKWIWDRERMESWKSWRLVAAVTSSWSLSLTSSIYVIHLHVLHLQLDDSASPCPHPCHPCSSSSSSTRWWCWWWWWSTAISFSSASSPSASALWTMDSQPCYTQPRLFSPSFNLLLFLDSGATVFHEPLGQPLDRGGERCDLHLLCQEPRTI